MQLMTPRAKANVVWSVATIRENGMNGLFDFFLDVIEEVRCCRPHACPVCFVAKLHRAWRSSVLSSVTERGG